MTRLAEIHLRHDQIRECASMAHEANRSYCASVGDLSQKQWDDAPEWQKESAMNGVYFHLANPNADASASHQNWYEEKLADGWSYGPEKDPEAKKHPCMVPFDELPVAQQIKDHIFRSVVHGYVSWQEHMRDTAEVFEMLERLLDNSSPDPRLSAVAKTQLEIAAALLNKAIAFGTLEE